MRRSTRLGGTSAKKEEVWALKRASKKEENGDKKTSKRTQKRIQLVIIVSSATPKKYSQNSTLL